MILVSVGYDKSLNPVGIFDNIAEIRDNNVYAGHFRIGKGHTAVYNKNVAAIFVNGHILAYLIKTAERNNL